MLNEEGSCQVVLKDSKRMWREERNFIFRLNERFRTMFNIRSSKNIQDTKLDLLGDKRMMESLPFVHFAFVY